MVNRGPSKGSRRRGDRGATAVEFALLLPLLLLMVFGLIDFGRLLNEQITLTQAAREGARLAALGSSFATVQTDTQDAATGLGSAVTVTWTPCPANATQTTAAVVNASYPFSFITPIGPLISFFGGGGFASSMTITATGEMPCES